MAAVKRELAMPQSSFRVKDLVGAAAKSRGEWWIDATAATAWLQPADVAVLPRPPRIYIRTHPHTPIHPIGIPISTISSSPSPSMFVPLFTFHSFTSRAPRASSSRHPPPRHRPPHPFQLNHPRPARRSPLGALIRLRTGTAVLMRM